jgi:hypothetical protein
MTDSLDELRRIAEELRTVFASERAAIATLDHGQLETLAQTKRELATRLGALRDAGLETSPAVRDLFAAIRVEARATAMLAQTANQAVRALLGYETGGYDRRGGRITQGPSRILAAR